MTFSAPTLADISQPKLAVRLQQKLDNKTKPLGSLGRVEALALQLGQILDTETPALEQPQMVVFAADHGLVAQGLPCPQGHHPRMVFAGKWCEILADGLPARVHAGLATHLVPTQTQYPFGRRVVVEDLAVPVLQHHALGHHVRRDLMLEAAHALVKITNLPA